MTSDGFFSQENFSNRTRTEYETFHARKRAGKRNSRVIDAQVALQTSVGNVNWIRVVALSIFLPPPSFLFPCLLPLFFFNSFRSFSSRVKKLSREISRWNFPWKTIPSGDGSIRSFVHSWNRSGSCFVVGGFGSRRNDR